MGNGEELEEFAFQAHLVELHDMWVQEAPVVEDLPFNILGDLFISLALREPRIFAVFAGSAAM